MSRSAVCAYLYDQRRVDGPNPGDIAAVRAEFATFAYGSTPIVFHGRRFRAPTENNVRAVFWLSGQQFSLPTTWLDDGQVLVQFPNYLRLVPGIGRFSVVTDCLDGDGNPIPESNTIDFAIEAPRPRISAVAPNMWSADPDFLNTALVLDDGFNPRGGDSYIARRDYYIQLRSLWQTWADGPVALMSELLPQFDFDAIPTRPAIVWTEVDASGVPIAGLALRPFGKAFAEPVDSGKLVSQIPGVYYNMPKRVQIQLLSPGPGGGLSNSLPLMISAPQPVINAADGLRPATAEPGAAASRLLIRGPENVPDPDDLGFQGNFNAACLVRWDGVEVPTMFLDSSRLMAEISGAQLTPGAHNVTVYTPDRGTIYFNPYLPDCDEENPTEECFAPSGGLSNAVVFNVQYSVPTIRLDDPGTAAEDNGLSPNCFSQFLLDMMPLVSPDSGFSNELNIAGTGFAPASVVHWNGQPRATTFVSSTQIKAQLLPEDLRVVGQYPVWVANPAPGGGVSNGVNACVTAVPPTLTVDDDGPADSSTIQQAIDIAALVNALVPPGDPPAVTEIVVRPGTYYENVNLCGAAILLRSETAGSGANDTIVDGGGNGPAIRAVSGEGPTTIVSGLTFTNGSSAGGGAAHVLSASPTFQRCRFRNSISQSQGGAIDLVFSSSLVEGCLIEACRSNNAGGGAYAFGGSPTLVNCTLFGNNADAVGGGVFHAGGGGQLTMGNCIVWGNAAPAVPSVGGVVSASYSLVQGGVSGDGNIDAAPRFVSAPSDLALGSNSPAIDAGSNALVSAGVANDLLGQPRFFNDTNVPDTGSGSSPLVDMGCLERKTQGDPMCPADINGDQAIKLTDLAILLTHFGGAGMPGEGDVDGDGVITLADLAILLSAFGTNCA
ncbi:MAG: IPT/TIG domain-containing protein [Phycisphaerae bacterium]